MKQDQKFTICIGRQLGSGGREIAHFLSERLGFNYYNRELLYAAAAKIGYSAELFEKGDEERGPHHSFLTSLIPFVSTVDYYGNHIDEEYLFRILSDTIQSIAKEENSIILGRCAEYILRENKENMLSIFITADEEERVKRLSQHLNITPAQALKTIHANDKRRAAFHDFYSNTKWGHAATYDLCINQSRLGMDRTKEFLLTYIQKRFSLE